MKKKLAALLCIMALVIPALCVSEMSDTVYTCDACKYAGGFLMVSTGTETRDGIPGEWISVQCPQCGAHFMTYWRPTGEAVVPAEPKPQEEPAPAVPAAPEAPAEPETPAAPAEPEAPAVPAQEPSPDAPVSPAEPEAPAAPPQEPSTDTSGSGNGGQQPEPAVVVPPENQQPSGPQAAETLPPVPAGNPAPADVPSGQVQQEEAGDYGTGTPGGTPSGKPSADIRRNVQKYPYFSAANPSRRLNLEGDPEALAPIPGMQVYPEPAAEGSSILRRMLEGNE